jgi:hypothetical protein
MPRNGTPTRRRRAGSLTHPDVNPHMIPPIPPPVANDGARNSFVTSLSGQRCALAVRGDRGETALLYLTPRECVSFASVLLACASGIFKDEDLRAPLRRQE